MKFELLIYMNEKTLVKVPYQRLKEGRQISHILETAPNHTTEYPPHPLPQKRGFARQNKNTDNTSFFIFGRASYIYIIKMRTKRVLLAVGMRKLILALKNSINPYVYVTQEGGYRYRYNVTISEIQFFVLFFFFSLFLLLLLFCATFLSLIKLSYMKTLYSNSSFSRDAYIYISIQEGGSRKGT